MKAKANMDGFDLARDHMVRSERLATRGPSGVHQGYIEYINEWKAWIDANKS